MKKTVIGAICAIVCYTLTSCASSEKIPDDNYEVAGYTLKSKKELMQQRILYTLEKTVLAQP
tara:strand:- start:45 stop:230 length:186 start_codon:yes stop_codon:yes gene_type:complete